MQYNESEYNGDSYNLTNYALTLTESFSESDNLTKQISAVRTESQGTADALGGSATLQAFLETITIYQRANTPFAYNNGRYNDFMYNARADEDEILLMATKALSDSISSSDVIGPFDVIHLLSESISESDAMLFSTSQVLDDFIFISENFRIETTNKALNETLRLADWVSIERTPVNNEWYD